MLCFFCPSLKSLPLFKCHHQLFSLVHGHLHRQCPVPLAATYSFDSSFFCWNTGAAGLHISCQLLTTASDALYYPRHRRRINYYLLVSAFPTGSKLVLASAWPWPSPIAPLALLMQPTQQRYIVSADGTHTMLHSSCMNITNKREMPQPLMSTVFFPVNTCSLLQEKLKTFW